MKIPSLLLGAALLPGFSLRAQDLAPPPAPDSQTVFASDAAGVRFKDEQLEQLLGPIALYPDALIALILPAATNPSDIVLAARYLQTGADPNQAEAQPWDDSVRSLAHYPDLVKWMDQNLAWTKQLGDAFLTQPAEVMNAVQRLRATARATGALVDTPQQQVVIVDNTIAIVPTQPDVIYVPYYDPAVVYTRSAYYYGAPPFSFGPPISAGAWLSYDLDWNRRTVWVVNRPDRERYWREHRDDWRRPMPGRPPGYVNSPDRHPWTPRPGSGRPVHPTTSGRPAMPAPGWNEYNRPSNPDRSRSAPVYNSAPQRPPVVQGASSPRPMPHFRNSAPPPAQPQVPLGNPIPPGALRMPVTVPPQPAATPHRPGMGAHRDARPGNPSPNPPAQSTPPQPQAAPSNPSASSQLAPAPARPDDPNNFRGRPLRW
jgi:hypothetical protein